MPPDILSQLHPVHFGHFNVQENEIVRYVIFPAAHKLFCGLVMTYLCFDSFCIGPLMNHAMQYIGMLFIVFTYGDSHVCLTLHSFTFLKVILFQVCFLFIFSIYQIMTISKQYRCIPLSYLTLTLIRWLYLYS